MLADAVSYDKRKSIKQRRQANDAKSRAPLLAHQDINPSTTVDTTINSVKQELRRLVGCTPTWVSSILTSRGAVDCGASLGGDNDCRLRGHAHLAFRCSLLGTRWDEPPCVLQWRHSRYEFRAPSHTKGSLRIIVCGMCTVTDGCEKL